MAIEFPANKFVNDTFDYGGMTYVWDGEKWTASGAAAFEDAYVNKDGDTMTGDLTVPSLNGGPLAGLRNQLINGDFCIWQRSADVTINGAGETGVVAADRWYMSTDGRYHRRSEAPDGFRYSLQVTNTNPLVTVYGLRQGVEMFDSDGNTNATQFKNGSQWTCSFWTTGNPEANGGVFRLYATPTVAADPADRTSLAPDVTFTSTGETSNGFTRYSATATVNTSTATGSGNMAVECFIGGLTEFGAQGRYTGVQLEPGLVATPFEHRPYGLELSLCQRYFQKVNTLYVSPIKSDGTLGCSNIRAVEMRTDPTEEAGNISKITGGVLSGTSDRWVASGTGYNGGNTASVLNITADAEL